MLSSFKAETAFHSDALLDLAQDVSRRQTLFELKNLLAGHDSYSKVYNFFSSKWESQIDVRN